jgi:thymidine kinase
LFLFSFVLLLANARRKTHSQRKDLVSSHNGMQMDGAVSRTDLTDASFVPSDVGCVAIDEGQFFDGIEEFVRILCKASIDVIVAGLWTDFQRNTWPRMVELSRVATRITWLNAICILCKSPDAAFSKRVVPGTEREMIGGAGAYVATCAE